METTARQLLDQQVQGVLALSHPGGPHSFLMAFQTDGPERLLFVSSRSSVKMACLSHDRRAAFLLDSRTGALADHHQAAVLTANGVITFCPEARIGFVRASFLDRHPNLVDFADSGSVAWLLLHVHRYELVVDFTQKTVWDPRLA